MPGAARTFLCALLTGLCAWAPAPAAASLVRPLFPGPLDIVGDVHGEAGALTALLDRLGYDGHGHHRSGRRLVFVGDLVDRGPDSVGVVDLVRRLVTAGAAQMVLGNHELNLMRGLRKHGNRWFYGDTEVIRRDGGGVSFQTLAPDAAWRDHTLRFLAAQPLALDRADVRVVHAAYHPASFAALRDFEAGHPGPPPDAVAAFAHFAASGRPDLAETTACKEGPGPLCDEAVAAAVQVQNANPVSVLTSGLERRAEQPFFSGGRWRWRARDAWWHAYAEEPLVVVGHYWRRRSAPLMTDSNLTGPDLFASLGEASVVGGGGGVFCVDYSVGLRYEERGGGWPTGALGTGLAALRLPEMVLLFDDGRSVNVTRPEGKEGTCRESPGTGESGAPSRGSASSQTTAVQH